MNRSNIQSIIEKSCKRIAPAWPLKNFVAVNPYSGFTDVEFSETAKILAKRGNIQMTMPIAFYLEQMDKGIITKEDVEQAFEKSGNQLTSYHLFKEKLVAMSKDLNPVDTNYLTLGDIASKKTGKDWTELMIDTISNWASGFFDEYVALWNSDNNEEGIYKNWKSEAEIDRSPELMGLPNFRAMIKMLPDDHLELISTFLGQLKLEDEEIELYLHTLLLKTLGWSSFVSGIDYNKGLYGGNNKNLEEFLAILLSWEIYFMNGYKKSDIKEDWFKQLHFNSEDKEAANEKFEIQLLLQEAYDFACQRDLKQTFDSHKKIDNKNDVLAQMVFCIDVRSEVYRRNLERVNPNIHTIGFAGFFGFPINYVPLGNVEGKNQCPVLIPSGPVVKETFTQENEALKRRLSNHQIEKTWKRFKSGAVTSFSFVSPLGLTFLPKLISNSFSITRPVENPKNDGLKKWIAQGKSLDLSEIALKDKVSMAAGALTGMGLKNNLAPIVLITGHGSSSTNNPHASGLDCGACGGHSGEKNALTAQEILNDPEVRAGLLTEGILIPEETLFVACLHDTTTDEISIVAEHQVPEKFQRQLNSLKSSLEVASNRTRIEKTQRLNIPKKQFKNLKESFTKRAEDWSQIRPEWGLAGCNAFIIAPRERTRKMNLKGKAFLQSYDWQSDPTFEILEGIMTAPMVVTSWINLQYFASTADNNRFGAGNKTLHNVTGGIGVLEGSGGDLRIGLPLQSVHDGKKFEHAPQRLNVIIDAPIEAINSVLQHNENIKQLCDNSWISLLRLDTEGKISHRYSKNLHWEELEKTSTNKNNLQTV